MGPLTPPMGFWGRGSRRECKQEKAIGSGINGELIAPIPFPCILLVHQHQRGDALPFIQFGLLGAEVSTPWALVFRLEARGEGRGGLLPGRGGRRRLSGWGAARGCGALRMSQGTYWYSVPWTTAGQRQAATSGGQHDAPPGNDQSGV